MLSENHMESPPQLQGRLEFQARVGSILRASIPSVTDQYIETMTRIILEKQRKNLTYPLEIENIINLVLQNL